MSRNWSNYQLAVFDANIKTTNNRFVVATAGSGKTTVIEKCIQDVPFELSVLAVAFGKDIKTTLEQKLCALSNVTVKTLNGFGYGACRNAVKRYIKIEKKKVENLLYFDVMGKPTAKDEKDIYYASRGMICRLIGLLKANMTWEPTDVDIRELMEIHGMSLPKKVPEASLIRLIQDTYKRNWSKTAVMDYDDQIAMPLYHGWPVDSYDRVYVDEAQDLTLGQIELTSLAVGPGGRVYYVGDPRQAIYLFRGADSHAVDNIINRMTCERMPLSICYRCSKAVVRRAQQKAPEIEFFEGSPEGSDTEVLTKDFRTQSQSGDFVLCRTTAPLVSECLRAIRGGKKASVRGREIGDRLIEFVDSVGYALDDTKGFLEALQVYFHAQQEKLTRGNREDALILLTDTYETIRVFGEECETVPKIKARIAAIFDDDQGDGIQFMTIHKSKGLEAPRVWCLRPDLLPHKLAKTDEQLVAEDNLWFVMVTRCQIDLFWVIPETREAV